MRSLFERVLSREGRLVTVEREEQQRELLALVQPLRPEKPARQPGPLGWEDGRQWLYLGQGPVEAGERLDWGGMALRVRAAAPWEAGGRLSHWWAILEREREAGL